MENETYQTNANVLFRGKRVDTAQWVYGWYCEEAFGRWPLKPCIVPSDLARDGELRHEQIILITLGQYTGLVDKNSVRIFAGDILEWRLYLSNLVDTARAVVEFKNGKFTAAGEDLSVLINSHDAVVVGNIYDETAASDLYSKVRSTVEHWPEWKKEIYNQSIAVSKHARKIEPVKKDEGNKAL